MSARATSGTATGTEIRPNPVVTGPARDGGARRRWVTRGFLAVATVLAWTMDAATFARSARRGPWRVAVAEDSMLPALRPGDWLLVDPTCRRWPRPGSVVILAEPGSGHLVIKRVAARHGPRGAWVAGDAAERSIDSRAYGVVDADALVGRAWFRYAPARRIGLLAGRQGVGGANPPSVSRPPGVSSRRA